MMTLSRPGPRGASERVQSTISVDPSFGAVPYIEMLMTWAFRPRGKCLTIGDALTGGKCRAFCAAQRLLTRALKQSEQKMSNAPWASIARSIDPRRRDDGFYFIAWQRQELLIWMSAFAH